MNFFPTQTGKLWFQHTYHTPLRGRPSIVKDKAALLREVENTYEAGQHYYLDHSQIHTIRAMTPDVVMVLFQYHTDKGSADGTNLYLPPNTDIPSLENLYKPFNAAEMCQAIARMTDLVDPYD